jgi:hypothetical protein
MVYDFINLCVGVPSPEDDEDGRRTIEYLKRCRRVMRLLLSNDASSLGLHPAVYFYSWTGKQQPILFLVVASLIVDLERKRKLPSFIQCRERFENFLMGNRSLINQIIRKFGTKSSGTVHLREFYEKILAVFEEGGGQEDAIGMLKNDKEYSYIQPGESPYEITLGKKMSTQVKSGFTMRELLAVAPRCGISDCNGIIPPQALSVEHKERLQNGGSPGIDNTQLTHPYCNTGYKESLHAKNIKALNTN